MEEDDERKQLDEAYITKVLSNIPEQYHKPSFQARKTALDYMRSSDRKNLLNQIENWVDDINGVTDQVVEVYFQGFNKSIHNYSRILEFMGDSHSNAISMGKEVEEINKLIFFNNLGIERLWRRNLEQYYMIQILEKMEELKLVPDLLNKYIDGNHFVHSSNLLVNSLNALSEKELINVNALKDLRQSLMERKEEFKDVIVEKLNDHIYLKTDSSVKMSEDEENIDDFNSNLKKLTDDDQSNGNITSPTQSISNITPSISSKNSNQKSKNKSSNTAKNKNKVELLKLEEISKSSISIEDLNINPESNGKLFMNLLVESLNVLDYLHPAVGMVLGKISIELKSIIGSCSNAVTQLYLSEGRSVARIPGESNPLGNSGSINSGGSSGNGNNSNNSGGGYHTQHDDQMSINILSDTFNRNDLLSSNTHNNIPLVDLLTMIFKKITKVFKNHLFLSKIFNQAINAATIKERSNQFDFKTTAEIEMEEGQLGPDGLPSIVSPILHRSKKNQIEDLSDIYSDSLVWEIIQKELREMLRVHLHDTSSLLLSTTSGTTRNNNDSSHSKTKLFSFSNSIVTDSWNGSTSPMLSSTSPSGTGAGGLSSPLTTSTGINSGVGIFKASQYNVTAVYPLIIQFTDQIESILQEKNTKSLSKNSPQMQMDMSSKILRVYIDDFVHLNFLQHIKNDYKERIIACVEATEAFKPLERYKLVFKLREQKPILNSALQIFQFISELFQDIVAMPQYVVEFGAIIQTCLLRYYEKCRTKFYQELDPTLTNSLLSTDLFKYLITALDRVERKQEPPIKFQDSREEEYEYKLESDLFHNPEKPVQKSQLILDQEKLTMIANINHSLEWLSDKVSQLFLYDNSNISDQHLSPTKTSANSNNINLKTPSKSIPQSSSQPQKTPKVSQKHNLLSPETMEALSDLNLGGIVKDFKDLARRCLLSLRVEYRIHCFYFLEGFKKANYLCEEERADQDSFIVDLNKDLSKNEETMSIYLTTDKCQFLFGGIAKLIGKLLIAKLVHIKQINTNGVSKLCKNVFTLQQNLSNIIVKREIFFDRVRQFYQALLVEDEFLNYIVEKLAQPYFSLDEGKIIMEFLQTTKRISANALQTVEAKYKTMLQPDNDKNKF